MNQTTRRCFVHIGAPKTGTTFLQKIFFENRDALARAGLLYPDVSLRGYGHHDFAFLLHGEYPQWATPQSRSLVELAAELKNQAQLADNILLSSEDFYLFPEPKRLLLLLEETGALQDRAPKIVVYVRRQDLAHESWYNQTVKAQGYAHSLEDCIREFGALWDYDAQIARWASVFGEESLIVRPYERAQFAGGTLAADFFAAIGFPNMPFALSDAEEINISLNRDLLAMQRLINRLPIAVQRKRRFHRQLIKLSQHAKGRGVFDERPLIDTARAFDILRAYEAGNTAVAKRYLNRRDLFFDAPCSRFDSAVPTGLTPTKVAYAFMWLVNESKQ